MNHHKILLYVQGTLQGKELLSFEQQLQLDKKLQQEVALYKDTVIGIQAYHRAKLKKKLDSYAKGFMPISTKEIDNKTIQMPMLTSKWHKLGIAASFLLFSIGYSWMAYQVSNTQIVEQISSSTPIDSEKEAYKLMPKHAGPSHATGSQESGDNQAKKITKIVEVKEQEKTTTNKTTNYQKSTFKKNKFKIAFMDITEAKGRGEYEIMLEKLGVLEQTSLANNKNQQEKVAFYKGLAYLKLGQFDKGKTILTPLTINKESRYYEEATWELAITYLKNDDKKKAKSLFKVLNKEDNKYQTKAQKAIKQLNRQRFFPFL